MCNYSDKTPFRDSFASLKGDSPVFNKKYLNIRDQRPKKPCKNKSWRARANVAESPHFGVVVANLRVNT